jgi:hypothetical protein
VTNENETEIFKFMVENGVISDFCVILNRKFKSDLAIWVLDMLVDISATDEESTLKQAFLENSVIQRVVKMMSSNVKNEKIVFKCLQILANITLDPSISQSAK